MQMVNIESAFLIGLQSILDTLDMKTLRTITDLTNLLSAFFRIRIFILILFIREILKKDGDYLKLRKEQR